MRKKSASALSLTTLLGTRHFARRATQFRRCQLSHGRRHSSLCLFFSSPIFVLSGFFVTSRRIPGTIRPPSTRLLAPPHLPLVHPLTNASSPTAALIELCATTTASRLSNMFSMAPPTAPLHLDVEAISGICGSISIACWVVVFSPQILENFRRSSADGLSLQFIIVWLAGDVFNILGAVLQGVLPTMCFYYRGFTWKDEVVPPAPKPRPARVPGRERDMLNERTTLLDHAAAHRERRGSDWSNLSPAVPLHDGPPPATPAQPTRLQTALWNAVAILMVCAAGVLGWLLSRRYSPTHGAGHDGDHDGDHDGHDDHGADQQLGFNFWGQVFGWLCAVLYLGSRLPQILLNYRRKSTEGVSMLFFLFACLGNLTYVLSIFAYDPHCGRHGCAPGRGYARYILVNLSWLAGSMGTLLLDMGIFVQFFLYRKDEDEDDDEYEGDDEDEEEADGHSIDQDRWDQRPLLARGDTSYP
ncbi:uncharacterized protein VDAG_05794 [Verticillium dahliae VdLs.17]|uniref:PQ loop repeat protein n=1 Tax=Verticillium dahliae (strain VdLs.17 / ATCC MYA-4575 / FGSC 10137) TaxID=498257 RepID=G2X6L2_VERDV|nr:uncharacterized protein VDAG_05794 [Verticillium dahliae VdLs.17]EGY14630.1 hypothetical protein VDAG_05794 [Verticillium dahliae VdLs.17]KAH6708319.1 PQ loop repeat-domain-containing protein [Verticillium dahliae]